MSSGIYNLNFGSGQQYSASHVLYCVKYASILENSGHRKQVY